MDRTAFEELRNLPGKIIEGDIRFGRPRATHPVLVAENIAIANAHGIDARLNIHYNPQVGSKTFNVHVPGVGPICRLDVDGAPHRPCGRSHKHSLQSPRCPDRNLPDGVIDRADLAGKSVREVFEEFCRIAHIQHKGALELPGEGAG